MEVLTPCFKWEPPWGATDPPEQASRVMVTPHCLWTLPGKVRLPDGEVGLPPFSYRIPHFLNQFLARESLSQGQLLGTRAGTVKEQREGDELISKVTWFLWAGLHWVSANILWSHPVTQQWKSFQKTSQFRGCEPYLCWISPIHRSWGRDSSPKEGRVLTFGVGLGVGQDKTMYVTHQMVKSNGLSNLFFWKRGQ